MAAGIPALGASSHESPQAANFDSTLSCNIWEQASRPWLRKRSHCSVKTAANFLAGPRWALLRQTFDADVLEVESAAWIMSLQRNGSPGWVEFLSGKVRRALHVFRLDVVYNGLLIELHGGV